MTSTSAKRRVLVVDDNSDITITIKTGLEDSGLFQVDTFTDPELALSSFQPGLYGLVLLDFKSQRCMVMNSMMK
jgi:DNA-binding response OmpR family regulator